MCALRVCVVVRCVRSGGGYIHNCNKSLYDARPCQLLWRGSGGKPSFGSVSYMPHHTRILMGWSD